MHLPVVLSIIVTYGFFSAYGQGCNVAETQAERLEQVLPVISATRALGEFRDWTTQQKALEEVFTQNASLVVRVRAGPSFVPIPQDPVVLIAIHPTRCGPVPRAVQINPISSRASSLLHFMNHHRPSIVIHPICSVLVHYFITV
jgi:hypothetical protein